jgi:hypothetical protein
MSERLLPQSFVLTAGESVFLEFTADADISGATVRFWMSRSRGPGVAPVITTEPPAPTAFAAVTLSPEFRVTINDEETEALLGDYVYDVELQDPFGNKTKAAYGFMTFKPQVA